MSMTIDYSIAEELETDAGADLWEEVENGDKPTQDHVGGELRLALPLQPRDSSRACRMNQFTEDIGLLCEETW